MSRKRYRHAQSFTEEDEEIGDETNLYPYLQQPHYTADISGRASGLANVSFRPMSDIYVDPLPSKFNDVYLAGDITHLPAQPWASGSLGSGYAHCRQLIPQGDGEDERTGASVEPSSYHWDLSVVWYKIYPTNPGTVDTYAPVVYPSLRFVVIQETSRSASADTDFYAEVFETQSKLSRKESATPLPWPFQAYPNQGNVHRFNILHDEVVDYSFMGEFTNNVINSTVRPNGPVIRRLRGSVKGKHLLPLVYNDDEDVDKSWPVQGDIYIMFYTPETTHNRPSVYFNSRLYFDD